MGSLQPWLAGRPTKEAQTASSVLIWWQEGAFEPDTPGGSLGAEVESASGIFPASIQPRGFQFCRLTGGRTNLMGHWRNVVHFSRFVKAKGVFSLMEYYISFFHSFFYLKIFFF